MLNTTDLIRRLAAGFCDDARAALEQAKVWDGRAREFQTIHSPREGVTRAIGSMVTRAQDERRKAERALAMATALIEAHDAYQFAMEQGAHFAAYRERIRAQGAELAVIAQQNSPAA